MEIATAQEAKPINDYQYEESGPYDCFGPRRHGGRNIRFGLTYAVVSS
jgi:hypothetical protein